MRWLVLLSTLLGLAVPASADTYVVNPEGTGDFPTIQAAIEGVSHGDIIELTDGVFTGSGNRGVNFLGMAVTVRSQSGDPETCVIDCQGANRGLYFDNGEGPGSAIEGITITNGDANNGGAIACWSASSPRISNCIFSECEADVVGGAFSCISWSSPAISDCRFIGNVSHSRGGAITCWTHCSPTVVNCIFTGNASNTCGAFDCIEFSAPRITQCTFSGNSAVYDGGALNCSMWCYPIMENCTLSGNSAGVSGGGIYCSDGAYPTLENTIIASSTNGQAVGTDGSSGASLSCCDLYGNAGGDWIGPIWDQLGIDGNISTDPLFCDDLNPEEPFRLWNFSPCTAENNPECGQIGAWGVGCTGYLVESDGTGDFPTIQAALDAASDGEIICLGNGTFSGPGNCDLDPQGRAVEVRSVSLDPRNCIIDCLGGSRGFTMHSGEGSNTVLRALTVANGHSDYGGGISCEGTSPTLVRCILANNVAMLEGGGMLCSSAAPDLVQCTLVGNAAPAGGGVRCTNSSTVTLENTLIAFGSEGEAVGCDATASAALSCCDLHGNAGGDWVGCIADQYGANGNISQDPLFCGPADYGLQSDSPCAPFSPPNEECDLIGACDVGCAGTYVVRADGTGDFPTIQDAIDAVTHGAVVELTDGVYTGEGNRDVDFGGKAITVCSQSGIAGACVIDCEAAARGFTFQSQEGGASVLEGVTITNGSHAVGGAIACMDDSSPWIIACTICANSGLSSGGAAYIAGSSPRFTGCTIFGNSAPVGGGLACINSPCPVAESCVFAFSTEGEAVFCYGDGTPMLQCCDLYGNAGGDWIGRIADQFGVNGNISEDPLFCDPGIGDFRLREDSPCAPFTPPNPECDLIGAWPVGCWSNAREDAPLPEVVLLGPGVPNPFCRLTNLTFSLPSEAGHLPVAVTIYDPSGRLVRTLLRKPMMEPGHHIIPWDGTDAAGRQLDSGLYFYRLTVGGGALSRRILRLR